MVPVLASGTGEPADTPHNLLTPHRSQGYEALDLEQVKVKPAVSTRLSALVKRFVLLLKRQVDPKRVVRKVSRHLVSLFFVLALVCYLDRANLAFAASQLREDLHFSASTYGVGAGQP